MAVPDVPVNKLGISDPERMAIAESAITKIRTAELLARPVRGQFDAEHLRAIHRRLMGDIYPHAGEYRPWATLDATQLSEIRTDQYQLVAGLQVAFNMRVSVEYALVMRAIDPRVALAIQEHGHEFEAATHRPGEHPFSSLPIAKQSPER